MKIREGLFLIVAVLASGCASSLKTFDSNGQASPGVPVSIPVLAKVVTVRSFVPAAPAVSEKEKSYCVPEKLEEFKFMPMGERTYIAFDPAPLGKGEFKLEFGDNGMLKTVSLNSDATAGVEKVGGMLGTVLPYLAEPKQASTTEAEDKAAALKEKFCLKASETISIERAQFKN